MTGAHRPAAPWERDAAAWREGLAPRVERVATGDALGRVLAAAPRAARPSPPVRCSAMDGIAVVAAEAAGGRVGPGGALRVDTGQAVPSHLDAVAMIEHVAPAPDGGWTIEGEVAVGQHVRDAGEDVAIGEELLPAGTPLAPPGLALLLAGGVAAVDVLARPRVAVVPTGDEVRPLADVGPGDVVDSNGPMLAAMLAVAGCVPDLRAPVPDREDALAAALHDAAASADLVVVLAGTSKGGRDRVPAVLAGLGAIDAAGLALRPGGPAVLGRIGGVRVACLPGYPVAAWVVAHLVVRPAVAALGARPVPSPRVARLDSAIRAHERLATAYPARLASGADGVLGVEVLPRRSSRLSALRVADALVVLPPGTALAAGELAEALPAG